MVASGNTGYLVVRVHAGAVKDRDDTLSEILPHCDRPLKVRVCLEPC